MTDRRLTQGALRTFAQDQGYPVSGRQFRDFLQAGLLPQADADGTWAESVADRLVAIRRLERDHCELRTLARRTIRLDAHGYMVADAVLVHAAQDVARTMKRPEGKMKLVWFARQKLSPPRIQVGWDPLPVPDLPKRSAWTALIDQQPIDQVAHDLRRTFYLAGATKPLGLGINPIPEVAEIDFEEIAVLMLIQDLALATE